MEATNLLTEELKELFKQYPIYSQDGLKLEAKVLVKYFNPYGAGTWLILEANPLDNGDYELYGYMHLVEWEYGYILLSQLQELQKNAPKMSVERDLYTKGEYLKDFIKGEALEEYKKIFMGGENESD